MKRLLTIPYAFVLMNWAAVTALYYFLRGRRLQGLWSEGGWPAGGAHRRHAEGRELGARSGA